MNRVSPLTGLKRIEPELNGSNRIGDGRERGVAMIELALMLPFLVLLFFGATEFVRVLQAKQNLAAIVREGANSVFRECLELDRPDGCMADVYARIRAAASAIQPAASVRISLYIMDSGSGNVTRFTQGTTTSRYSVADFNAGGALRDLATDEKRLAVAEAAVSLPQIIPIFPNPEFYDAAIF